MEAQMTPEQIQPTLDKGGANFKLASPDTWPEQALLAANNRWASLKTLQDSLQAGVRVDAAGAARTAVADAGAEASTLRQRKAPPSTLRRRRRRASR